MCVRAPARVCVCVCVCVCARVRSDAYVYMSNVVRVYFVSNDLLFTKLNFVLSSHKKNNNNSLVLCIIPIIQ